METRYFIIFATVIILLQLFLWVFHRTLAWWINGKLGTRGHLLFSLPIFIFVNLLILLTVFRIYPQFRLSALVLICLLYILYTSLIVVSVIALAKLLGKNSEKLHRTLRIAYPFVFAGFFMVSLYNAYVPRLVHYQIQLDKPIQPLRIGMASDFHLGKLFGAKQLDTLADIFNQQKVDLILLPGDIMDDNVTAYLAENMRPHLSKLKAPLGVYATLGNHDFFGHQKAIKDEIEKAGIQVLFDQTKLVNNQFILIGRNDELRHERPSTKQLLKGLNTELPIILLDHRPTEIEQHSKLPIDIQVSGHAHKGQVFPANLITWLMYRLDYGYEKIGNGHFFVTSGYGFWGVPFRLGSQSEVLIIDVK